MRIIAGEFRGRKLKAPSGRNTRPTPDRVREALFSVLGDAVEDARVVEMFGGTGSLGLESLSRGAEHAVFFEKNRAALSCLKSNVETLGVGPRVTIHAMSVFRLPKVVRDAPPFDIAFCDPPHRLLANPSDRRRIEALISSLPLSPGGLVLLEHPAGDLADFAPEGMEQTDLRNWSSTGMAFFTR